MGHYLDITLDFRLKADTPDEIIAVVNFMADPGADPAAQADLQIPEHALFTDFMEHWTTLLCSGVDSSEASTDEEGRRHYELDSSIKMRGDEAEAAEVLIDWLTPYVDESCSYAEVWNEFGAMAYDDVAGEDYVAPTYWAGVPPALVEQRARDNRRPGATPLPEVEAEPTQLDKYEEGAFVFLRSDEGSIGEGVVIEDQGELILVKFAEQLEAENATQATYEAAKAAYEAEAPHDLAHVPPEAPVLSTPLVVNRHQVALTLEGLTASEPPLQGLELQEILQMATNVVATEATRIMGAVEKHARDRWGAGSDREGAFKAAAIGALIGSGQGQIGGASPTTLGIIDSVARTVAIALLRQAGHQVAASELERVQEQGRIEARLNGAPIKARDPN